MTLKAGPDYETLWRNLEQELLRQQNAAKDNIVSKVEYADIRMWQGICGGLGNAVNTMRAMLETARDPAKEDQS